MYGFAGGAVRGWGGDYLSVKNQRFLPPPLQGEARVRWEPWCGAGLPEVRRWMGRFSGRGTRPLRERREIGRVCRRCGGGWEVVLRQSLRLPFRADTSLYTREARGAAAPEEGFGCGGGRRLCGRSMIAPTYTTGNVTNSHCFSAKSNLFSHGTGNPSPTFSIATELCNFELKYRR